MGRLNLKLLSKGAAGAPAPAAPPSGSFTVDANGRVVTSTVPSSFPETLLGEIARAVLRALGTGQAAQVRLSELSAHYPALKITARPMRGGAIVYLTPYGGGEK